MTTVSKARANLGRALLGGLAAGLVAAVVNALVFALGGIDPNVLAPGVGQPIALPAVILASLLPNVLGGLALWAVLRAGRGVRTFQIIVAVATVLSMLQPLTIPGAQVGMVLTLEVMHLVAGAAAILVTPRVALS